MNLIYTIMNNKMLSAFKDTYSLLIPIYVLSTFSFFFGIIFNLLFLMIPLLVLIGGYSVITFCGMCYQLDSRKTLLSIGTAGLFFFVIELLNYETIFRNLSIIGVISTIVFVYLYLITLKYVERITFSFKFIPPAICEFLSQIFQVLLILILAILIGMIWNVTNLYLILNQVMIYFSNALDNILVVVLVIGSIGILWFKGINAGGTINAIIRPFLLFLALSNLIIGTSHIVTEQFFDLVWMGGSGATLSCVLALKLSSSPHYNEVYSNALGPAVFNINEAVVFGLPIYENKYLKYPFVIAPIVIGVFQFIIISNGLVPVPNGLIIPWFTPPIISGIIVTGSLKGGIMQLIAIIIGVLIYYPFIKKNKVNTTSV